MLSFHWRQRRFQLSSILDFQLLTHKNNIISCATQITPKYLRWLYWRLWVLIDNVIKQETHTHTPIKYCWASENWNGPFKDVVYVCKRQKLVPLFVCSQIGWYIYSSNWIHVWIDCFDYVTEMGIYATRFFLGFVLF